MSKRLVLIIVCFCFALTALVGCSSGNDSSASTTLPAATATPTATPLPPTPTTVAVPLYVNSVDLAVVDPTSIAGKACNSSVTISYKVTFHIVPNSTGGTIKFAYTTNNGRSQTEASQVVNVGETTKVYNFTSSGTLYSDHTFPGNAIIMVTSPNNLISAGAKPAGSCM